MSVSVASVVPVLAAIPAAMSVLNALFYRRAPIANGKLPLVSVLIPARNEESSIESVVKAALASRGVQLEVLILDDHSEDRTAEIAQSLETTDTRVRLLQAPTLPPGWCGKQHACHILSQAARHPLLAFIDADVRLEPHGLARLIAFQQKSGADLVSGIPRQETGTFLEKLIIPLIHFLLLGFLPLFAMRLTRWPAFGAGCGQLFLTTRDGYEKSGGHAAIKSSLHDGLTLPRVYRRAGLTTDLCDATDLAVCRMYRTAGEVWLGLAKNAREGMAGPVAIWIWTLLLFGGQVMPYGLLLAGRWLEPASLQMALIAIACGFVSRIHGVVRFQQSWLGALLHPVGISLLLAIQCFAIYRRLICRPIGWKGRSHPSAVEARSVRPRVAVEVASQGS